VYLTLLPLPDWLSVIRPDFFVLVILYWIIQDVPKIGLFNILLIGILLDVFLASPIGTHGLALVFVSYIAFKSYRQLRFFPLWQQSLFITIIYMTYSLIIFFILSYVVAELQILKLVLSGLSVFIIWPWVKLLFDQIFYNDLVE